MSFWQNLFSTLIGALLGFIFSICLFYFQNKWSKKAEKESLEKNLVKEFEFNEHYLQKVLDEIKKVIEKITVDDRAVYYFFNYLRYQRLLIQTYFQQGYLYEKLDPEDISVLDTVLTHMGQVNEYYLNNSIQRWKEGTIDQKEILGIMAFERDTVEKYIKDLHKIKQKIVTK